MAGRKRKSLEPDAPAPNLPRVAYEPRPHEFDQRFRSAEDAARPRELDVALGTRVCEAIACGQSLARTLQEPWAPTMGAFLRWLGESDELSRLYTRARETCADVLADETVQISDEAKDSDSAAAARVRVAARQWYASKLKPRVYGDQVQVGLGAAEGGIVINLGRFVSPSAPAAIEDKREDT